MRIYKNAGNAGEDWASLRLSHGVAPGEVVEFCIRGEDDNTHFKTVRLTRHQVQDLITQLTAFVDFPKEKLGTIEGTDYTKVDHSTKDRYGPRSCS